MLALLVFSFPPESRTLWIDKGSNRIPQALFPVRQQTRDICMYCRLWASLSLTSTEATLQPVDWSQHLGRAASVHSGGWL